MNKNSDNTMLTEDRVREIAKEEAWKVLIEVSKQKLRDIEEWQKYHNSDFPNLFQRWG
jgi:hypothetical protein